MAVSARAQAVEGVEVALVAMATQLNLDLLDGLGLAAPAGAGEHDLLVAIKAADSDSLSVALAIVDEELNTRPGGGREYDGWQQSPRTTASAAARVGPGIALISVPGQYAFAEALDALNADCDVMIFSDNVPVEQEVKLKEIAAERDLLVMGPDCGTAIVGGLGYRGAAVDVPDRVGRGRRERRAWSGRTGSVGGGRRSIGPGGAGRAGCRPGDGADRAAVQASGRGGRGRIARVRGGPDDAGPVRAARARSA